MRVLLLGPFDIRDDKDQPVELAGARLRALVARLAFEAGREVSADALIDAIWEDDATSSNALQALVSRVRRAIGADKVTRGAAGYRLDVKPGDVDLVRFERLAEAGRRGGDLATLREAESLWRGPALADLLDYRFAQNEAVRLERLRTETTRDRLALEVATGTDVLAELEPLAAAHALDERWQALHMRALYATGRPAEALDVYEQTRERLADELGADPSSELADLHLQILRQSAAPAERPVRRSNLKSQLTSFVGREDDLAALVNAVEEARLVTVTGPGGAGKTRLATETAARIAASGSAPDGVWFVELASTTDGTDVAPAVLRAIGAREAGLLAPSLHDAESRLEEYFADQRALLVLDNCEHQLDGVADLAARLLGACPGLRVITTSREAIAIGGERLFPIPPLAVSDEDPASSPAVRLFVERAAAVRPGFKLDASNTEAVVEICRRLDGLPLAVELAAARMRALDAAQIAARLDDRFALLAGSDRTAPARHRTLSAVIAWSWELLSDAEKSLAMRMSVYPAGLALERVEDLDALAGLVDKSLVDRDGERYRMLETIRSYAVARLEESGDAETVADAMAKHCLELAEAADAELRTAAQIEAMARLTAEHGNLVTVIGRAAATADIETGLRMVAAMFWYWHLLGSHTEFRHWTNAVLAVPAEIPEPLQAAARILEGIVATEQDGYAAGEAAIREGVAMGSGIAAGPARFLVSMGPAFLPDAPPADERGLDGWELGTALLISAAAGSVLSGVEGAAPVDRAQAVFAELGERWGLASALRIQGERSGWHGDLEAAERAAEEAARLLDELGTRGDASEAYAELSWRYAANGSIERAWQALDRGIALAEAAREPNSLAYVRWFRVPVLISEGRYDEALAELPAAERSLDGAPGLAERMRVLSAACRDLLTVLRGEGRAGAIAGLDPRFLEGAAVADLAMASRISAAAALAEGDAALAARRLGFGRGMLGADDGRGYDTALRTEERAREALGDKAFQEEYDRGAALGREDAAEVLGR
ncbi:BTAD domain-containing putative transcriptional regulator [Glycomyces terrestris]|uniref:Helix-turn-helix domain-containing protein n=1 Tax=Glycomyces terrestris TaxID=2493553 RepID=A0A426UY87_9ACTN|nr:BTAD domain-containing putative transcriptional regulator [Glycomyces terrestris]RRR99534.1 helix-turn-helix domain-containing protein [Glycomyces terrestris]